MTESKIQKGVPIPTSKIAKRYPFKDMEVGDSFLTDAPQQWASAAAIVHGKRVGQKFTTRVENGGTRVWRIA